VVNSPGLRGIPFLRTAPSEFPQRLSIRILSKGVLYNYALFIQAR